MDFIVNSAKTEKRAQTKPESDRDGNERKVNKHCRRRFTYEVSEK